MSFNWLQTTQGRLAISVNAAYLVYCLLISGSGNGLTVEHYQSFTSSSVSAPVLTNQSPFVAMPPRLQSSGKTQATSFYLNDSDTSVYPIEDLRLIAGRDLRLQFSPIISGIKVSDATRLPNVLFRFYSYGSEQHYSSDSVFELWSDGNAVWSSRWGYVRNGHTVTLNDGGEVVESLSYDIPYEVFLRIVSSKKLQIRLGVDQIDLTSKQFDALRDLQRCIEASRCV
jgi:hypothetical protein